MIYLIIVEETLHDNPGTNSVGPSTFVALGNKQLYKGCGFESHPGRIFHGKDSKSSKTQLIYLLLNPILHYSSFGAFQHRYCIGFAKQCSNANVMIMENMENKKHLFF